MNVHRVLNTNSPSRANVAVVGAGLIGRLIALSLSEQGHLVTLFDKDNKDGKHSAAYAAAGLLTPLGEAMHSEPNIVEMGFTSLKLWPNILAKLKSYTYFQQSGTLIVSHEQDISDYQRLCRYLASHYPLHNTEYLDRAKLLALEPEIGRSFNHGLFLPEEGQLGNRKLLIALKAQLDKSEITWNEHCDVVAIEEESFEALVTYQQHQKQSQLGFDVVVDCRGSGARAAVSKAIPLHDLRAVRGELFQLYAPDVCINRPIRLMHPRYQLYIAPKPKGHYVVGATEIESDDMSPMTVRSSMELLSAAYSVHPGFAEANIRQQVSQLRPAFSDNQPKISTTKRLLQINGLYRHGFLIAPVVLAQAMFALNQQLASLQKLAYQSMTNSPYDSLLAISEN